MEQEQTKEEKIMAIKVFTPYHQYYHTAYYYYDENIYGRLKFGDVVRTTMGLGVIIEEDVPDEDLPTRGNIYDIGKVADEKDKKIIEKEWWSVVLEIHQRLKDQEKK